MLKRYYKSCMVVKQKDCIFWKVELALNEDPGLVNLPVLRHYLTAIPGAVAAWTACPIPKPVSSWKMRVTRSSRPTDQASQILGFPHGELLGMSTASWAPGLLDNNNSPEVSLPVDFIRGDGHMVSFRSPQPGLRRGRPVRSDQPRVRGEGVRLIEGIPMAGFDPLTKLPNRDWFRTDLMQYPSAAPPAAAPIRHLPGRDAGHPHRQRAVRQRIRRQSRPRKRPTPAPSHPHRGYRRPLQHPGFCHAPRWTGRNRVRRARCPQGHRHPARASSIWVVTASTSSIHIGVVMSSGGADGMDSMLTNAEDALKQSRKKGDCAYHIFGLP